MDAILRRLLLVWLLMTGWAFASAPPQQTSGANNSVSCASGVSATLTSTPANSLIVVGAQWAVTTQTVSFADSASDTFTAFPASPTCSGTVFCGQGFYTFNAAGGVTSVTGTTSGASECAFTVAVYSGMASTGTLDQSASASGTTGTLLDSGLTATTTNANDTLVGLGMAAATTFTAGTTSCTYTMEKQQPAAPNARSALEDCNVTSTGTYKAQMTQGASQRWVAIIGAFKQSGGAPPPPHELLLMGVGEQASRLTSRRAFGASSAHTFATRGARQ